MRIGRTGSEAVRAGREAEVRPCGSNACYAGMRIGRTEETAVGGSNFLLTLQPL